MVSLPFFFMLFIILFGIIGAMRGWARELLVAFSVILALFIISVMENFVPLVKNILASNASLLFWVRTLIVIALVFFGYQTPNIPRLAAQNRFARDRLQDILLGVFLGALNGWLIIGSIWWYMNAVGYPFSNVISAPSGDALTLTNQMMLMMPPALLSSTTIYFAIALAFAFVLIVFI